MIKMNDREWEQFWTWLKQNFQNEEGGHFREILEDIRQLYEGHVSISDIGASKFFLVGGFIVPPKQSDDLSSDWSEDFEDITDDSIQQILGVSITPSITLPRSNTEDDTLKVSNDIPKGSDAPCPNCGSMRYRIVYTDDEMTEVKFYDCLMCRHSWC